MYGMLKALALKALGFVLVALLCAQGAAAAGKDQQPTNAVASMSIGGDRVDWLPTGGYERLELSVTGPGDLYLRQEAEPGKAPFLSLFKPNGDRLPDGIYTYELRVA